MDPFTLVGIAMFLLGGSATVAEGLNPGVLRRLLWRVKKKVVQALPPSTQKLLPPPISPYGSSALDQAAAELEQQHGITPPGEPQQYFRGLRLPEIWEHIEPEISFSQGLVQDGFDIEYGPKIGEEPTGKKIPTGREIVVDRYIKQYDWVQSEITGWKKVGERQVGWKQTGVRKVERSVPGGKAFFRRIKGFEELHLMSPAERAIDAQLGFINALTGQATVRSWMHEMPVYEPDMEDILKPEWKPVWEPVWEDVMGPEMIPEMKDVFEEKKVPRIRKEREILYLLVDASGSIYDYDQEWILEYWRGIQKFAIEKARAADAKVMHRFFASDVFDLTTSESAVSDEDLLYRIMNGGDMGGTNITRALYQAVQDLEGENFEQATVVIISDGQDGYLDNNAIDIVLRYMDAGVTLHSIMLTDNNAGLRFVSDKYQVIPQPGTISELVWRSIN